MPAMADATIPVATTSRIIPLIMNELLIFRLHFARVESGQCGTNWAKAAIARRIQAAKKTRRPGVFGELLEHALDAYMREAKAG
jgi:hypothetical protein